jgi:WD40 repeat protein
MRYLDGHRRPVLCLAYSPDGCTLASGSSDATVRLWDTASGEQRASFTAYGTVMSLAFSPDGGALAVGTSDRLSLWGARTQSHLADLSHASVFHTLAFSPDGRLLAAESRLYDIPHQRVQQALPTFRLPLYGLAFAPDSSFLAAAVGGGDRGEVLVLEPVEGSAWTTLADGAMFRCVAISPDGRTIAAGGRGERVRLWDVESRREWASLDGHTDTVLGVAFTPDGRALVTATIDGIVKVWDLGSGTERAAYNWEIGTIRAVAVAPDGMTAAVGGFDNRVLVWDLA